VGATDDGRGAASTEALSSPSPCGDNEVAQTGEHRSDATGRSATPRGGGVPPPPVGAGISGHDGKALVRMMREHDHRLRSLAYHLLGDPDLMDDVMQDVYVKAFLALPHLRRRSAAGTWLYRVTYTTCIDVLRRQRRLSLVPGDAIADVPDPAPDPDTEIAERERLSAALGRLPPEQRVAVLLVDREGFDYRTVAEILDVPFGTAASRVHAARHALRRALGSPSAEGSP
jgi:RNA polymerase sigma-70 factor, ECF subfamily